MDKIVIETVDDSIKEENEVFVATLSTTNRNVQIDKGAVMTITIIDNDGECFDILILQCDVHGHQNNFQATIILSLVNFLINN